MLMNRVYFTCYLFTAYFSNEVCSFLSNHFAAIPMMRGSTKRYSENWLNRPDEEVIHLPDSSAFIPPSGQSLFDALYNSESGSSVDNSAHSVSQMTIREISQAYQFSIEFLGDFAVQLGCQPPLDIDIMISKIMTGEQIFSLLNALNTLDAYEANAGYDSVSLKELAASIGVSKERIIKVAKLEEVNLPFGMDTVLHMAVAEKVRDRALMEQESDGDSVIDVEEDKEEDEYGGTDSGYINIGGTLQ